MWMGDGAWWAGIRLRLVLATGVIFSGAAGRFVTSILGAVSAVGVGSRFLACILLTLRISYIVYLFIIAYIDFESSCIYFTFNCIFFRTD